VLGAGCWVLGAGCWDKERKSSKLNKLMVNKLS
jgi:hypothetical protein